MPKTEQMMLLNAYDDLAVDIVSSTAPNTDAGMPQSNMEIAEIICARMGWEDFDLLGHFDFDSVYASESKDTLLSYAFIAFLRWRLFATALQHHVGVDRFSAHCAGYSEYWYLKLVERWNVLSGGAPTKAWLH